MYDKFSSFDEVRDKYRRCRTVKEFMLDKDAAREMNLVCAICKNKLTEHPPKSDDILKNWDEEPDCANICEYYPKVKKILVMHYICAWGSILKDIFKLKDRLY